MTWLLLLTRYQVPFDGRKIEMSVLPSPSKSAGVGTSVGKPKTVVMNELFELVIRCQPPVEGRKTAKSALDKLFIEVRNTSGTLLATLATYSNVNKGTAGVYSQKSFNLAAYKGQTVRVQFRATTDSSVTSTFRVDDVSLK